MKCFVIIFFICSLMIFPGEEEKSTFVVKKLIPETQKEKPENKGAKKKEPFWNLLKKEGIKEVTLEKLTIEELKLEEIVKITIDAVTFEKFPTESLPPRK